MFTINLKVLFFFAYSATSRMYRAMEEIRRQASDKCSVEDCGLSDNCHCSGDMEFAARRCASLPNMATLRYLHTCVENVMGRVLREERAIDSARCVSQLREEGSKYTNQNNQYYTRTLTDPPIVNELNHIIQAGERLNMVFRELKKELDGRDETRSQDLKLEIRNFILVSQKFIEVVLIQAHCAIRGRRANHPPVSSHLSTE